MLFSNVKKGVNTGQYSPVSLEWNTVAVNQRRRRRVQCCVCVVSFHYSCVHVCFCVCFCLTGRTWEGVSHPLLFLAGVATDLLLPSSPVPVASQGFLPTPPSRRRTAEGPGPCRWGRRSGEVGWVSCSPFLPFYRFMGAQSFSKYLPFPLYCGRLMAFDVRGWRCRGSGCRAGGRSGWIGGDPVRVHVCEPLI